MIELDLDLYELSLSDAALLRHLQRRCLLCAKRTHCLEDIAHHSSGSSSRIRHEWLNYCPNSSPLEMLAALRRRALVTSKYSFPYFG
jgi:hypothetical protein